MSLSVQSISSQLHPLLDHARNLFQRYPRTILLSPLLLTIPWAVDNYHKYLSIGRGGLPYNPKGWAISCFLKLFSRETMSTEMYDADPDKESWLRDADSIPERRGARPVMSWHILPHRQLTRHPTAAMKKRIEDVYNNQAALHSDIVELADSPHERVHDGIMIRKGVPSPHKIADHALREIVHIHRGSDYSLHVTLAPKDCKLLIERGWGERHPLSGNPHMRLLPKEYIMIYAPRDEEELAVLNRVMETSIAYMTGRRDIL